MPGGSQDKTEKATPKRRQDARAQGKVAKSRELPSAAVLLAGLSTLAFIPGTFHRELTGLLRHVLGHLHDLDLSGPGAANLFHQAVLSGAAMVLPVMGAVFAVAVLLNYIQVGALFTLKPLEPKLGKLNPLSGLKNMFSFRSLVELTKNLLKLTAVGLVAYWTLKAEMPNLAGLGGFSMGGLIVYLLQVSFKIFLRCTLLILFLALMDFIYQKWDFEKSMKMSKQEVKDEFKQREGDPLVRSRIRQIQRKLASQRMMQAVPKADVVVTNPTHLAVALVYTRGEMDAPKVVAKGSGLIAEKIKQLAQTYGVPLVENQPLARALFKLELGQLIPAEMYKAVAEVLAFVYQAKSARRAEAGA